MCKVHIMLTAFYSGVHGTFQGPPRSVRYNEKNEEKKRNMKVHSGDRCYSRRAESGIACRSGEKIASDHRLSF